MRVFLPSMMSPPLHGLHPSLVSQKAPAGVAALRPKPTKAADETKAASKTRRMRSMGTSELGEWLNRWSGRSLGRRLQHLTGAAEGILESCAPPHGRVESSLIGQPVLNPQLELVHALPG